MGRPKKSDKDKGGNFRKNTLLSSKAMTLIDGYGLKSMLQGTCCGVQLEGASRTSDVCLKSLSIREVTRMGFAKELELFCTSGHSRTIKTSVVQNPSKPASSPHHSNVAVILNAMLKGEKFDDINETYAGLGIGKIGYGPYQIIRNKIQQKVKELGEKSRRDAVKQIVSEFGNALTVEMDGTYSKRYGHNANFGVTICIHSQTKKIIGVAVFSRYCHIHKRNHDDDMEEHECQQNWEGSAGSMETEGFVHIGCQLLMQDDIWLVKIIADGDSKGFDCLMKLVRHVYDAVKLNDKSHFGKRFLRGVESLKGNLGKRAILADGKALGGGGRLTTEMVKKMGQEIASNLVRHVNDDSSLEDIERWIRAPYFHRMSCDEKPQHEGHCDLSFCRYLQALEAGEPFVHDVKKVVPEICMKAIESVFDKLCAPELLESLRHSGNTDRVESTNSSIWHIDKKDTFSSAGNVEFAVNLTTIYRNEGHEFAIRAIFEALDVELPESRLEMARKKDRHRKEQYEKYVQIQKDKQERGKAAADERNRLLQQNNLQKVADAKAKNAAQTKKTKTQSKVAAKKVVPAKRLGTRNSKTAYGPGIQLYNV